MRKDEAAKLLPIIKAFSEGKEVQYKANGRWYLAEDIAFFGGGQEFRIKPEPKYRPFKDAKECWQEMQKHQPFGWIQDKYLNCYKFLTAVQDIGVYTISNCSYEIGFKNFIFVDGAPFGIKVEE